ncbi:MAG: nitrilase-related carbon-nitrogen hydrolase, partial [Alphaproteobacteria bacterium]
MSKLTVGLVQMSLKGDASGSPETCRDAMIEAHIPFIEEAGKKGVQVLCLQELFNGPYFCAEQNSKWYALAEKIPDGHTVSLMRE